MMDIKGGLLLQFTIFFDKKSAGSGVNMYAINEKLAEELCKLTIKNLKKEQLILHSKTIFGVLIQLICN